MTDRPLLETARKIADSTCTKTGDAAAAHYLASALLEAVELLERIDNLDAADEITETETTYTDAWVKAANDLRAFLAKLGDKV